VIFNGNLISLRCSGGLIMRSDACAVTVENVNGWSQRWFAAKGVWGRAYQRHKAPAWVPWRVVSGQLSGVAWILRHVGIRLLIAAETRYHKCNLPLVFRLSHDHPISPNNDVIIIMHSDSVQSRKVPTELYIILWIDNSLKYIEIN